VYWPVVSTDRQAQLTCSSRVLLSKIPLEEKLPGKVYEQFVEDGSHSAYVPLLSAVFAESDTSALMS
jgi:hypothetical protein